MRSNILHDLYLGFNMSTGVPKVGVLQNAAWNLSDTCRFKLLPPPQPDRSLSDKDKRDLQVSLHIHQVHVLFRHTNKKITNKIN